jgi:multisubunit Na+/H+ antiporter MnhB subunit
MIPDLDPKEPLSAGLRMICATVIAVLTIGLIAVVLLSGDAASGLQAAVAREMPASGVENPVTAVLLNFRSYDTLLEIAVLLLVAIAVIPLVPTERNALSEVESEKITSDPILNGLTNLLVPLIVLISAYMLWTGAYAPGGAFHAGALLASAGVLLSLSRRRSFSSTTRIAHFALVAGLAVFVFVGVAVAMESGRFLQYPPAAAGLLILLIESAATLSIAATLLLLYEAIVRPVKAS